MEVEKYRDSSSSNTTTDDDDDDDDDEHSDIVDLGHVDKADGVILKVSIRNFMCHDYLEVEFNKSVNFIIGRNGSGKSAILTAVVVGLGARANVTNRGASIKSLIKSGADSATVEITLKNDTFQAYKHDLYGDSITIVRTIHASGTSIYKIKSACGKVISTKSSEVSTICTVFNIQVANPLCVLNQDEAKSLHSTDAKSMYDVFQKSVNMDVIRDYCKRAEDNCKMVKHLLHRKETILKDREREVNVKQNQLKTRLNLEKKLKNAENEFYWCKIVEDEETLKKLQSQKTSRVKMYEILKSKAKSLEEDEAKYQNLLKVAKQKLEGFQAEEAVRSAEFNMCNAEYQTHNKEWKKTSKELDDLNTKIAHLESKIAYHNDEMTKYNPATVSDKKIKEQKRVELNLKVKEYKERQSVANNELYQANVALEKISNSKQSIKEEKDRISGKLANSQRALRALDEQKNVLAVYGPKMASLKEAISQAHSRNRFSAEPIGPIGAYIKVNDEKWSPAIEQIVGRNLSSFCVNNGQDSRTLQGIINNVYGNDTNKPGVSTSRFLRTVHNVSQHAVVAPPGYQSALDSLTITEPVVANYLIDTTRCECILLAATHNEAVQFTSNVQMVPRNCSKVISIDRSEYYPAPSYRAYGGSGQPSKLLQVSTEDRKRQLQQEIHQSNKTLQEISNKLTRINDESRQMSSRLSSLNETTQKITRDIRGIEENLRVINVQLEEMDNHVYVNQIITELDAAKEELVDAKRYLEDIKKRETVQKAVVDDLEKKLIPLRMNSNEMEISLKHNYTSINNSYERIKSEMRTVTYELESEKKRLNEFKNNQQLEEAALKKSIEEAKKIPRVTPRAKNVVEEEINGLKMRIESMNEKMNQQKLLQDIQESVLEFQKLERIITGLKKLNIKMETTTSEEVVGANYILKHMSSNIQIVFNCILAVRNYVGKMVVDHNKGTLELQCTGRDRNRMANKTVSLSGGERSYATVAFILSLWESMELPFYFLDEFDVFMDNINRNSTIELLLDHTMKSGNISSSYRRQYVFLTPLQMSLNSEDRLTIHRLADPQ